jgi:hypothetical protein
MAISEGHRVNFDTLRKAAENGDLALVETYARIGGAAAVMLCAIYKDAEEQFNIIPFAQMLEGNPYANFVMEKEMVAKYWGEKSDPYFNIDGVPRQTGFYKDKQDEILATHILMAHLEEKNDRVMALRDQFTAEVVSRLPEEWALSAKEIDAWVAHAEKREGDDDTNTESPSSP